MTYTAYLVSPINNDPIFTNKINVLLMLVKFIACIIAFGCVFCLCIRSKIEQDISNSILNVELNEQIEV
jgi:hypothetical protein